MVKKIVYLFIFLRGERMTEAQVESYTRQYLKKEGWKLTNLPRTVGQQDGRYLN